MFIARSPDLTRDAHGLEILAVEVVAVYLSVYLSD
jgi:hypothetical protein